MKKFLLLTLAIVMTMGLAVPAMAFTQTPPSQESDAPYELDIYLVEVEDSDWGMPIFSLPPSDRGYAKNEIVCAVVTVTSPNKHRLGSDSGYHTLSFGGQNVTLNVRDNYDDNGKLSLVRTQSNNSITVPNPEAALVDGQIVFSIPGDGTGLDTAANFKMAWAFYGKITNDDALMYVNLSKSLSFHNGQLEMGGYVISVASATNAGKTFEIALKGGNQLFRVYTNKSDASTKMDVFHQGTNTWVYEVFVDQHGEIAFAATEEAAAVTDNNGVKHRTITSNHESRAVTLRHRELMAVYNDYVEEEFGFDFHLRGNVVNEKTFTGIANADDIYEEVAIEPWYAYVEVPDNIQVEPPKTGDAASLLGLALLLMAGAAVAALGKARRDRA